MRTEVLFAVALAAAELTSAAELRLDLPDEAGIAGRAWIARAVVTGGEVESATARLDQQSIRLDADGESLPILFALPLHAESSASLTVHVRLTSGEDLHATATLRITPYAPPTPSPAGSWNIEQDLDLNAAREEQELATLVAGISAPRRWSRPFSAPARAPLLAEFGVARGRDAGGVESPRHLGVDYAMRRRASVRAPAAGVVRAVRVWPLLGETIVLDHGLGVASILGHLDIALVRESERVEAGAVLAWAGSSGVSDGVVLHYGLYVHGRPVAPHSFERLPSWLVGSPPGNPDDALETPPPDAFIANTDPMASSLPAPEVSPTPEIDSTPEASPTPDTATPMPTPVPVPSARVLLERILRVPATTTAESFPSALDAALRTVLPTSVITVAPGQPRLGGGDHDLVVTIAGGAASFRDAAETALLLVGHLAPRRLPDRTQVLVVYAATGAKIPVVVADARNFYAARRGGQPPERPDADH